MKCAHFMCVWSLCTCAHVIYMCVQSVCLCGPCVIYVWSCVYGCAWVCMHVHKCVQEEVCVACCVVVCMRARVCSLRVLVCVHVRVGTETTNTAHEDHLLNSQTPSAGCGSLQEPSPLGP